MMSIKTSVKSEKFGVFLFLIAVSSVIILLSACVETTKKINNNEVSDNAPLLTMPDLPMFKSVEPGTPEELLAAEGNWNLVEEGDVYDPSLAHMAARKKVNPKQMRNRDDLVAHFEPDIKGGSDGKFRVLKMEPQGEGWQDDLETSEGYQVAETSIAKPTQKVVGTELVEKIRTAFAQQEAEAVPAESTLDNMGDQVSVSNIPVPLSKPIRSASAVPVPKMDDRQYNLSIIPPPTPAVKNPPVYEAAQLEPDFTLKSPATRPLPTAAIEKKTGLLGTLRKTLGQDSSLQSPIKTSKIQSYPPEVPAPHVKYQVISSGKEGGGISDLRGFRSAIHDGKTRIAMDLSSSVKYKVAIDQIRNVLRVKLEKTRWLEPTQGIMRASGLLGTYVTKAQPDGSIILEVRMKKKTKITDTMILKPDRTAHHRIVIDLQS